MFSDKDSIPLVILVGTTDDMTDGIADSTIILEDGYKALNHNEITDILRKSMQFKH